MIVVFPHDLREPYLHVTSCVMRTTTFQISTLMNLMSSSMRITPFALPYEIWNSIIAFLCISDINRFAQTSRVFFSIAERYTTYRRRLLTKPFLDDPDEIYRLLAAFNAVISGSSALSFLLPEREVYWTPHDLDIYVSEKDALPLLRKLSIYGYCITAKRDSNEDPYPYSSIQTMFVLRRGTSKIDVVTSKTSAAISPIFQYHSTILFNFLTADSVFCAYPELTLRRESLINPFAVYGQALKRSTLQALLKYHSRGIKYVSCRELHKNSHCCKASLRSVDDNISLWMKCSPPDANYPIKNPSISVVKWRLGGSICNGTPTYVSPYSFVNNSTR